MPAPLVYTFSAEAKIAANTTFVNLLDTGTAAKWKVRDAADVLLAEALFDDPCGTVNGTTGQVTFVLNGRDESAVAGGTAAYVEFTESDDTVHLSIPVQQGTVAVSGFAVMNSLAIVAGAPFEIITATIG